MPSPRRPHAKPCVAEPLETRWHFSATFSVASLSEFGAQSIGSALQVAQPGDTIDCTGLRGTIPLFTTLQLHNDVKIIGPGSDLLTIDGTGQFTAFEIDPQLNVSMSGFTVAHGVHGSDLGSGAGGVDVDGSADDIDTPAQLTLDHMVFSGNTGYETGGAISGAFCNVNMADCRFTANTASGDQDALGGGIYLVNSSLTATRCTFDHNTATAAGTRGGYANADNSAMGGGLCLMSAEAATLTNCTIDDNTLTAAAGMSSFGATQTVMGAGLLLAGDGNFTMNGCTVADNVCSDANSAAGFGGGVAVLSFGTENTDTPDTLKLINSIVAGNTAGVGDDAFGLDVSASANAVILNNVFGVTDDSGVTAGRGGNVGGTAAHPLDARLNGLADNGGATPTMSLRADSPALGIAVNTPSTDQRGQTRVAGFDAGAYDSSLNLIPVLYNAPLADAATDHWYSATVTASQTDVSIAAAEKPAWLTVTDNGDGTARLTGTPGPTDDGLDSITLQLTDNGHTFNQTFDLNVGITPAAIVDGVLHISGSAGNDTLHVWQPRGAGTAYRVAIGHRTRNYAFSDVSAIQMYGRAGDDAIICNCTDLGATVDAGDGNDTVTGGVANDFLNGGAGDDKLYGMGGNDFLRGNSGRDYLDGGDGSDRISGGNGHDTLDGGVGRDVLYGDGGPDFFIANDGGRDYLFGGPAGTSAGLFDRRDIVSAVVAYAA